MVRPQVFGDSRRDSNPPRWFSSEKVERRSAVGFLAPSGEEATMSHRGHISKGSFVVAGGGPATIGKDTSGIRRGAFMTGTPVTRSNENLQAEFPEMSDSIASAGPVPTTVELAQHWARQAELERRLADLKARIKAAKR
jgi:hypothetical protein